METVQLGRCYCGGHPDPPAGQLLHRCEFPTQNGTGTGQSASSQTQSLGAGGSGATEGESTGSLGVLFIEGTGKVSGTSRPTGPPTSDFSFDHLERLAF